MKRAANNPGRVRAACCKRGTYGRGHPFAEAIKQSEQTAEARAEKKAAWNALVGPRNPQPKRNSYAVREKERTVKIVKAKAKIGYMDILNAAIARAKAGVK